MVSEDLAYQASGDVNPSTANLTSQGLQRSLLMAPFLQQNVLGVKNVTGIYALEPMTHLQTTTTGYYPDMVALETIQQFALLNQITLSSDAVGGTFYTGNNYPINASYALGSVPIGVATPSLPCPECQGLDFDDQNGDNETLVTGIVTANVPGFYVFSAPWETTSNLLANINALESYNLTLPASHQGPNNIYAISIAPSGSASLVTFNSNLNPPSTYPVLPPPGLVSTPCTAQTPSSITVTGGSRWRRNSCGSQHQRNPLHCSACRGASAGLLVRQQLCWCRAMARAGSSERASRQDQPQPGLVGGRLSIYPRHGDHLGR